MTTTAAPATAPFRFFDVHVTGVRRLSPSMVRITFGGERLDELASGAGARVGDRLTVLAPVVEDNGGVDFRPPPGTDWILLTGDETALPAIAGILAWLSPGTRARVWIETAHADDRRPLPTFADAEVTW